jgi:xanthine dehydrogenase small subunit
VDGIRFLLDGRLVCVEDLPRTMTVLEYLREVAHRTGTKEGCAEGDCGACTVVLGELDATTGRVEYRAVNSCIRFLPTIDGHELVTVESLSAPEEAPHPVQQSMMDHHASQCGFCTPGFVMSLFALYLREPAPDRERVVEALSGNLCRCTGYRPIIDAGVQMGRYPTPPRWGREACTDTTRCESLRAIRRERSLRLPGFFAPRTVDELAAELAKEPRSLVLAGGTDVGLWVTKQLRELPPIVYVGAVEELKQIRRHGDVMEIGAAVSLTDGWRELVSAYPTLDEMAQRFGSPPVRNSGTLCGNLANGSPIGDSLPVLIALGAELVLCRGAAVSAASVPGSAANASFASSAHPANTAASAPGGDSASNASFASAAHAASTAASVPGAAATQPSLAARVRTIPLEKFYLGYQRTALDPGEFVTAVRVPTRVPGWIAAYKLSKRFDQDISSLAVALAVQVEAGRVTSARIAFGGMAAIAMRAAATERALIGAPWNESSIDAAAEKLAEDFKPLTDMRASSAYRLQSAGNLLRRFYFEHSGPAAEPTRTAAAAAALATV